ncbi:hypothetical protein H4582DRAFT_2075072 [Lactarius indigo]|nr:hypothetical protein H4582DRAFT_2075072 [Lactarius indigo]
MNRPRDSLLNLFDPLFSAQPSTPPPCPSPDLGSDKENAAPLGDSPITLTKFFNRTYTRYKAQLPHPLPKGRLIDFGDPNVSYDSFSDDNDDDDDEQVPQDEPEPIVIHNEAEDAQGTPQRRPLADIALGDGSSRSSPVSIPKKGATAAVFGSPSSFRLARPTPAPSSSPLASVINAINGTTMSPSSPPTPSAPHIAVTPAAPPSPSPTRRQLRPGATLRASPDADARRVSVDLQESLSVHFGESSFDLLKDKILFPENDSLGDLEMDLDLEEAMLGVMAPARSVEGSDCDALSTARTESSSEPDTDDVLSERLKDMYMASDDEEAVDACPKADDHDKDGITSTPPVKFTDHAVSTPSPPVRQFIHPKTNRLQAPTRPNPAPPVAAAGTTATLPRRSARGSISALPAPIVSTAALRITKKANKSDVRKTALPSSNFSAPSSSVAGGALSRAVFIGGVQRPTMHTKSASMSVLPRGQTSQQGRPAAPPSLATAPKSSLVTGGAGPGAGPRPSGLRPPTSRVGSSGIVAPRASVVGGAARLAVAGGVGRVGSSSGVMKPVAGKSDGVRMMRRV